MLCYFFVQYGKIENSTKLVLSIFEVGYFFEQIRMEVMLFLSWFRDIFNM